MSYIIVILLTLLVVRNVRKDKTDGRDYLGGHSPKFGGEKEIQRK